MADNYLERRMEQHRAAQSALHTTSRPAQPRAGRVVVNYPPQRVVVNNAESELGEEIIKALVAVKCHVSIVVDDQSRGSRQAQLTGGRFIPGSLEDALGWMQSHGEHPDIIINLRNNTIGSLDNQAISIEPRALKSGPRATAAWCVFASHPANRWLF